MNPAIFLLAAPRSSAKPSKHYEDIEAARKRKARADENTSRSSRMIYVLNQQVKDIQNDLDRMQKAGSTKPVKKVCHRNETSCTSYKKMYIVHSSAPVMCCKFLFQIAV